MTISCYRYFDLMNDSSQKLIFDIERTALAAGHTNGKSNNQLFHFILLDELLLNVSVWNSDRMETSILVFQ